MCAKYESFPVFTQPACTKRCVKLCKRCVKLCKVVYYMNHTTQLCGSYSTQLYTTDLHAWFIFYTTLNSVFTVWACSNSVLLYL